MKTKHLTIFAILLLIGCSKEIKESDYVFTGESGTKVTFSAVINDQENASLTRATAISWETGDVIGITCGDKQINVAYEYTGGDGNYFKAIDRSQEIWLMGTEQYAISAYHPYSGENGSTPENVVIETTSENQDSEEKRQKMDYLYASAIADRENPNIQLAFKHVMSRIVLTFKEGEEIESLSDIDCYITGAKLSGTFNPNTGETAVNEESNIESVNQVLTNNSNHTMIAIFLPQTLSKNGILIEAGMNGVYYKVELSYADLPELKAGYSYNYTIVADRYNDNPIKLTITETEITPWINNDGGSFTPDPSLAGTEGDITPNGWGDIENENVIPVEKQ
jgi:hypothetical protein